VRVPNGVGLLRPPLLRIAQHCECEADGGLTLRWQQ
jgi:hypothetical protein